MTTTHTRRLQAVLLTALLLTTGIAPAAAAEAGTLTTHVGRWIAAQGNAALREIAEEARRELDRHLQPMLPEAPAATAPKVAGPVTGPADSARHCD